MMFKPATISLYTIISINITPLILELIQNRFQLMVQRSQVDNSFSSQLFRLLTFQIALPSCQYDFQLTYHPSCSLKTRARRPFFGLNIVFLPLDYIIFMLFTELKQTINPFTYESNQIKFHACFQFILLVLLYNQISILLFFFYQINIKVLNAQKKK